MCFPPPSSAIYLLLTGNLKHLLRMRLISSTMVLLVIAAPWHIAAAIENPAAGQSRGFLWFYFVNEHFLRYLGKRIPHDYDTVPLLIFWALVFLWLFPWSAFLVQALAKIPHRWSQWRSALDRRQRAMFLLCHLGGRDPAVLQFFYAPGVLRGSRVARVGITNWRLAARRGRLFRRLQAAAEWTDRLGSAGRRLESSSLSAAIFLLAQSKSTPADSDLADLLKKNPTEYALAFGHIFDLTPRALGLFRVPLATFAIALFVGCVLNLLYRRRNLTTRANWTLTIMMVFVLFAVHQGLVMFSPILSSKKLADAVEQEYRPGDLIISYGTYEDASTLNFYVRQPIHVVNTRTEGDMYLWIAVSRCARHLRGRCIAGCVVEGARARVSVGGGRQDPGLHQAGRQLPTGAQRGQADFDEQDMGGPAAVKKFPTPPAETLSCTPSQPRRSRRSETFASPVLEQSQMVWIPGLQRTN